MKPKTSKVAACLFALDASAPARVQIFPAGRFDAPLGALQGEGPWTLDGNAAAALMARVAARKNPIHFDYHHASLFAAERGIKAPAAGWLATDRLAWEEGRGLFGLDVEWTDAAAAAIQAKEYRYLSPVFVYDAATGIPLDLVSVALTNTPAIDGMADLLAAASALVSLSPPDNAMDELFERLCYLLNLPLTTTVAEMGQQLDKLKAMLGQEAQADPQSAAAGLLGVLEAKNAKIAALSAAAPDPARYVPIAALQESNARLAALEAESLNRRIDDLVEPALSDGRLLPGQEAWARELGKTQFAALEQFLTSAKPLAALQRMQTGGRTADATDSRDAGELAERAAALVAEKARAGIVINVAQAVEQLTTQR